MRRKQKEQAIEIAQERVDRLFEMAEKAAAEGDFQSADRYVEMAWGIKQKFRIKLNDYQKRLFCRKCRSFLAEGDTGRYRTEGGMAVVTCLKCGNVRRYPLNP